MNNLKKVCNFWRKGFMNYLVNMKKRLNEYKKCVEGMKKALKSCKNKDKSHSFLFAKLTRDAPIYLAHCLNILYQQNPFQNKNIFTNHQSFILLLIHS